MVTSGDRWLVGFASFLQPNHSALLAGNLTSADQCYSHQVRLSGEMWSKLEIRSLRFLREEIGDVFMPRSAARFRISIKDYKSRSTLRVELIEARGIWGERRYRLRLNDKEPAKIKEATLTEVFDQLRRWLVRRAEKPNS